MNSPVLYLLLSQLIVRTIGHKCLENMQELSCEDFQNEFRNLNASLLPSPVDVCYSVIYTLKTFNNAQAECQGAGGRLAWIRNLTQDLRNILIRKKQDEFWIGIEYDSTINPFSTRQCSGISLKSGICCKETKSGTEKLRTTLCNQGCCCSNNASGTKKLRTTLCNQGCCCSNNASGTEKLRTTLCNQGCCCSNNASQELPFICEARRNNQTNMTGDSATPGTSETSPKIGTGEDHENAESGKSFVIATMIGGILLMLILLTAILLVVRHKLNRRNEQKDENVSDGWTLRDLIPGPDDDIDSGGASKDVQNILEEEICHDESKTESSRTVSEESADVSAQDSRAVSKELSHDVITTQESGAESKEVLHVITTEESEDVSQRLEEINYTNPFEEETAR